MRSSTASAATVSVNGAALDVSLANGASVMLPEAQAGASIVDAQIAPLNGGGDVVTWIEAYSHQELAHYAVLDASGAVMTDVSYGSGLSTGFEAIAVKGGGFILADAETNLFGTEATLTSQLMNASGGSAGSVVTVASGSSATGGLDYTDLGGVAQGGGAELIWNDSSGQHMAYVGSDGSVQMASTQTVSHAVSHHPDWFVLG